MVTSDVLTKICMPSGANFAICSSLFGEYVQLFLLGDPGGAEGELWHRKHYIIRHLDEKIPSAVSQKTINPLQSSSGPDDQSRAPYSPFLQQN